jgi:hypothetical protein
MKNLGRWSEEGVPKKGWVCVAWEDLGEPDEVCGMCLTQEIRYVHTMHHPKFGEELRVGVVCAGNMEQDLVGAKTREEEGHKRIAAAKARSKAEAVFAEKRAAKLARDAERQARYLEELAKQEAAREARRAGVQRQLAEEEAARERAVAEARANAKSWRDAGAAILAAGVGRLEPREASFVVDMLERFKGNVQFNPTAKQTAWFVALYRRHVEMNHEQNQRTVPGDRRSLRP